MIKTLEKYINSQYPNLNAFNFRTIDIDETSRYTFQTTQEDFHTIALLADTDLTVNEFKKYIRDFIEEFKEVGEQELYCKSCQEDIEDCECGESEASVAAGLGFIIDDDGDWVPNDNEYSFGYSYPEKYSLEIDGETQVDVREYMYFIAISNLS